MVLDGKTASVLYSRGVIRDKGQPSIDFSIIDPHFNRSYSASAKPHLCLKMCAFDVFKDNIKIIDTGRRASKAQLQSTRYTVGVGSRVASGT